VNLHTASRKGGSSSDCLVSAFGRVSAFFPPFQWRFLHGDFRIAPSFAFSRPPPTTVPYHHFWDNREMSGWVGHFSLSFFFLANFLFCSPVTALSPPR